MITGSLPCKDCSIVGTECPDYCPVKIAPSGDVRYTGSIRCPYCGTVNEYTNETCYNITDEGDSLEMLCKRCGERIEPHGGVR